MSDFNELRTRFAGFECRNTLRIVLVNIIQSNHIFITFTAFIYSATFGRNVYQWVQRQSRTLWTQSLQARLHSALSLNRNHRNRDNEVNGSPQRQPMTNPGLEHLQHLQPLTRPIGRSTPVTLSSLNCLAEGLPHSLSDQLVTQFICIFDIRFHNWFQSNCKTQTHLSNRIQF